MQRSLFLRLIRNETSLKEQTYAPDAGKANEGINDTAYRCDLTSEDPCHQVKTEQTDNTPVQCADNGEDQCCSVHVIPPSVVCCLSCGISICRDADSMHRIKHLLFSEM